MPRRRDLLAALAATGTVGGVGYHLHGSDDGSDGRPTASDDSEDADGADSFDGYETVLGSLSDRYEAMNRMTLRPSFQYQPVRMDTPDDDRIDAVSASPVSGTDGDYLVVTPADSAPVAESYLRDVLGGRTELRYEPDLSDREATFLGGETGGVTYLLWSGTIDPDGAVVLAGRGVDREAAEAGADAAVSEFE